MVEEVLRDHVRSRSGVDLRLGHLVLALAQDNESVVVTVRDAGGTAYEIAARYLLGCDGASGIVRDQIGARYVGYSDTRPNFNVVFRAPSLDTHLGPAVQYWVLGGAARAGRQAGPGRYVVGHLPRHRRGVRDGTRVRADQCGCGRPVDHHVLADDPWTARMLVADSFADRRVFLVGESAHVNPPWGGHGFNTCVGDAVNIAWKIAAVEQGWAGSGLLASYEPERRGVIEQTVASAASNMTSLAGDLPREEQAIQRTKRAEFYSLGLVLGYTYAGSPVIQPDGRHARAAGVTSYTPVPEPGARLPHCWLPDGSSLFDQLGDGFSVVGPVKDGGRGVTDVAERARSREIPLSLVEPPASYPWREEYLLVRPDQHIAWRARDPAGIDLDLATGADDG